MTDTKEETVETEEKELPPAQEERIVDKVVNKVRDVLADLTGTKSPEAETETEDETEDEEVREPTTIREIESDMETKVKEALAKIGADEAHAKEHEKLAAMKAEAERPPVQLGKVTRWLWGGEQS